MRHKGGGGQCPRKEWDGAFCLGHGRVDSIFAATCTCVAVRRMLCDNDPGGNQRKLPPHILWFGRYRLTKQTHLLTIHGRLFAGRAELTALPQKQLRLILLHKRLQLCDSRLERVDFRKIENGMPCDLQF